MIQEKMDISMEVERDVHNFHIIEIKIRIPVDPRAQSVRCRGYRDLRGDAVRGGHLILLQNQGVFVGSISVPHAKIELPPGLDAVRILPFRAVLRLYHIVVGKGELVPVDDRPSPGRLFLQVGKVLAQDNKIFRKLSVR